MIVCLPTLLLVASGRGHHVLLLSVLPLLLLVSLSEQQSTCSSGWVKHLDERGDEHNLKISGRTDARCMGGIVLIDENDKATFIHMQGLFNRFSCDSMLIIDFQLSP